MRYTPAATLEAADTMVSSIPTVRKERVIRPAFLEQENGEGAPRRVTLSEKRVVMGRADDTDILIKHPKASRHHAVIEYRGGEYIMRDNNSRNGFYLNGLRVYSAVLREGDVLQVTDCVFVYHER